MINMSSIRM